MLQFGWNDVWPTPWLTDAQAMALLRINNAGVVRFVRGLRIYNALEMAVARLMSQEPLKPSESPDGESDRVPRDESIANLSFMIAGRPAVVLTPGYDPKVRGPLNLARIARYNAWTRDPLAGRAALVWPEAMLPSSANVSDLFFADGFHPNARGAEILAETVADALLTEMAVAHHSAAQPTAWRAKLSSGKSEHR